jgi:anti-sigma B factor antagonist
VRLFGLGLRAPLGDSQHAREARTKMPSRIEISTGPEPEPVAFAIIERQLDERTTVVSVEGELDLTTAPRLKWTLLDALEAGRCQLVLDLSRCGFMDSTALGVLVGVNRSLDAGARLAIACTRSNVLKIFELSGMDGAFALFATVDEALAYAQGRAAQVGG